MKKLISHFLAAALLLAAVTAYAHEEQPPDTLSVEARHRELLQQAYRYMCSANGQEADYYAAIAIFYSLADENNAQALYMLGNLHLTGTGFEQNDSIAKSYYLAATERGSGNAALHIASMIADNEQWTTYEDWQKNAQEVFRWITLSVELGAPAGYHIMGLAYYRGLGVQQDYQKALQYFELLADRQEPFSAYMAGICYLNGYGTERNVQKGKTLIQSAATAGHTLAKHVMTTIHDFDGFTQAKVNIHGNLKQPVVLSDTLENKAHKQYRELPNNVEKNRIGSLYATHPCVDTVTTISGDWMGKITTYDWSGKTIIEEQKINLALYEIAGKIYGTLSDDNNTIDIYAVLKDSVWIFTPFLTGAGQGVEFVYAEQNLALKYATLHYDCDDNGEFLSGNLWLYNPPIKGFIQPTLMSLMKAVQPAATDHDDENNSHTDEEEILAPNSVIIYPNPFSDMLNLKFTLNKPVDLSVTVFSSMGSMVYNKTGKYVQGEHIESMWFSAFPGIYTLRISGVGVNYLTQIIKN